MTDDPGKQPKIIVDSDWKEEARREKEQAERQVSQAEAEQIPPPTILELVQMLIMQIQVALGLMQDPQTGRPIPPHLPLAKHYIDLLDLLREKTEGKLEENEKKIIEGTLHELRMAFVQIAGVGSGDEGEAGSAS